MFKHSLSEVNLPDFILTSLCMTYITMVISSIILFDQILNFNLLGINVTLSGGIVPYVFLYPISFIVLRVYGFKYVNHMIGSMILVSLIFVIMSKIVVDLSSNLTAIHNILENSFKMYIAGFIGMPAGIYTSFLIINLINKLGLDFNIISLSLATIIGETVNTVIVFPVGFHGQYTLHMIFNNLIVDALVFKILTGIILACFTVIIINVIVNNKTNSA